MKLYFGLNDLGVERNYVWEHSNQPLGSYRAWGDNEGPASSLALSETEDCIVLSNRFTGIWRDVPCNRSYHFICEYP